jgi:RNA polymerase sigma-70 factor (ECF subfamily)
MRLMAPKLRPEEIVSLHVLKSKGQSNTQIAHTLGVSEGTVRSRLFYAHRQLQNYLEEFRKNHLT